MYALKVSKAPLSMPPFMAALSFNLDLASILSAQLRQEIKKLELFGQGKYEPVSLIVIIIILISFWYRCIL